MSHNTSLEILEQVLKGSINRNIDLWDDGETVQLDDDYTLSELETIIEHLKEFKIQTKKAETSSEQQPSKKVWMVYREENFIPTKVHFSFNSAKEEALRLSEKHSKSKFHILETAMIVETI